MKGIGSSRVVAALCTLAGPGCWNFDGGVECGNRDCPECPCMCRADGKCPGGDKCYGGICLGSAPDCYEAWGSETAGGLEPNNYPELAVDMPCGDPYGPDYGCSCPTVSVAGGRRNYYQNGFQGVAICPEGDLDYFRLYLFANERVRVHLGYQWGVGRDLNLMILKIEQPDFVIVAQGASTNDDEDIDYVVGESGYYYLVVLPARPESTYDDEGNVIIPGDIGEYYIMYELNPPECDYDNVCDPYETMADCASDCPAFYCGNWVCEGESDCSSDCFCGNGTCDWSHGESSATCQDDCPYCEE